MFHGIGYSLKAALTKISSHTVILKIITTQQIIQRYNMVSFYIWGFRVVRGRGQGVVWNGELQVLSPKKVLLKLNVSVGLRLNHLFFLERVMVALKKAH